MPDTEDTTVAYKLTRIESGSYTEEEAIEALNAPIKDAEEALSDLSTKFKNINTKSAVVCKYMPLAADVIKGSLVYFDTSVSGGLFRPAQALLNPIPGINGETLEQPCARVEGIVVELTEETDGSNNVLGSVLLSGYWESADVVAGCMGTGALAGLYYLSPTVAGMATRNPGPNQLRQPILSYYGNGRFNLSGHYLAHDNHFHSSATLNLAWQAASAAAASAGVQVPETTQGDAATYAYVVVNDPACSNLGTIDSGITAVFKDGLLETDQDALRISDGILWSFSNIVPLPGSVTLFNHYPFAYGSAVIRSIRSANDALTVNTVNGTATLQVHEFSRASLSRSAEAVASIEGNKLYMTPVVTAINRGPGIAVSALADGSVTLALSDKVGTPLDAYSINHNGTHPASDNTSVYILFPQGRAGASFVMSMPVSASWADTTLKAYAWGALAGASASFNVSYYWFPLPEDGTTSTDVPTTAGASCTLSGSGQSGKLVYMEGSEGIEIQGNGMLYARVTVSGSPVTDIKMMRAGFKLVLVQGSSASSSTVNMTNVQDAIVSQLVTGAAFAAFKAVKTDSSGKLVVCRGDTAADCDSCIGVAIEASEATGSTVSYIVEGLLSGTGQTYTPGGAVYIGADGSLTQVNPQSDDDVEFLQKVGMAVSTTTLQIGVRPGILK